jgi:hypothetical protein
MAVDFNLAVVLRQATGENLTFWTTEMIMFNVEKGMTVYLNAIHKDTGEVFRWVKNSAQRAGDFSVVETDPKILERAKRIHNAYLLLA